MRIDHMARGILMGDMIDRYHGRGRLGRFWLKNETPVFFAMTLLLCAAIPMLTVLLPDEASAAPLLASEFVVPNGPVITFQDGQSIDGHIIGFDQSNVIIRTKDGAEQTLPRAAIDTVRFETVTGTEIAGALLGWMPGVYELTTAETVVTVYSTVSSSPKADDGPEEIVDTVAKREAEPIIGADTDRGVISDAAAATTNDSFIKNKAEQTDGVDEQLAAASPVSDLEINVSTNTARENGKAITFDIELSRPSENSVVLIYATIDGTAIDGEDYVATRGVLVIKAGQTTARIETPVINDDLSENDENLQLFLTADPAVAMVKNRKIFATIEDDDQG